MTSGARRLPLCRAHARTAVRGARHALERDGEGRRAGRVPALRLGRLVAASARGRPSVRAVGTAQPRAPEVICLAHYDRLPGAAVTFSRRNVAKRDHHTCQYCGAQPGAEAITIDHVVPRSQGGASSWTNCVAACIRCNALKADRTPEQAGMKPRRRPVRPEWKPLYAAQGVRVGSGPGSCRTSRPCSWPDRELRPGIGTGRGPFRGVLLGEQRASKTRGQGSNPCAPAPADVAER